MVDWLLLGVVTIAALTGAALVLLLVEPDAPGRSSRSAAQEPAPRSGGPSPGEPEGEGRTQASQDEGRFSVVRGVTPE